MASSGRNLAGTQWPPVQQPRGPAPVNQGPPAQPAPQQQKGNVSVAVPSMPQAQSQHQNGFGPVHQGTPMQPTQQGRGFQGAPPQPPPQQPRGVAPIRPAFAQRPPGPPVAPVQARGIAPVNQPRAVQQQQPQQQQRGYAPVNQPSVPVNQPLTVQTEPQQQAVAQPTLRMAAPMQPRQQHPNGVAAGLTQPQPARFVPANQTMPPQSTQQAIQPQPTRPVMPPQQVRSAMPPQAAQQTVQPQQVRQAIPPQQAHQTMPPQQIRPAMAPQPAQQAMLPQQVRPAMPPQPAQQTMPPQQVRPAMIPQQGQQATMAPQWRQPNANQAGLLQRHPQPMQPAPVRQPIAVNQGQTAPMQRPMGPFQQQGQPGGMVLANPGATMQPRHYAPVNQGALVQPPPQYGNLDDYYYESSSEEEDNESSDDSGPPPILEIERNADLGAVKRAYYQNVGGKGADKREVGDEERIGKAKLSNIANNFENPQQAAPLTREKLSLVDKDQYSSAKNRFENYNDDTEKTRKMAEVDADLGILGNVAADRKAMFENVDELNKVQVDKRVDDVQNLQIQGKVKSRTNRYEQIDAGYNVEGSEEEEEEEIVNPNIAREEKGKREKPNVYVQAKEIKNKWETGAVEGARIESEDRTHELEEVKSTVPVKERYKEHGFEIHPSQRRVVAEEDNLDPAVMRTAKERFQTGQAYRETFGIEPTKEDVHFSEMNQVKHKFEGGKLSEDPAAVEAKKQEIEEEFKKIKMEQLAVQERAKYEMEEIARQQQNAPEYMPGEVMKAADMGLIKKRFEGGQAFQRETGAGYADPDMVPVQTRNVRDKFEKGVEWQAPPAEVKKQELEDEFRQIKQMQYQEQYSQQFDPNDQGQYEYMPDLAWAAQRGHKARSKWEKLQAKEAKKAEKEAKRLEAAQRKQWEAMGYAYAGQ